jgi:hypothetical protein
MRCLKLNIVRIQDIVFNIFYYKISRMPNRNFKVNNIKNQIINRI